MDGRIYGLWNDIDIKVWVSRSPEGAKASNTSSYSKKQWDGTAYNNEYFIKNPCGDCKFPNVLQGENFAQADDWYPTNEKVL